MCVFSPLGSLENLVTGLIERFRVNKDEREVREKKRRSGRKRASQLGRFRIY